jgi:hypothetical protein
VRSPRTGDPSTCAQGVRKEPVTSMSTINADAFASRALICAALFLLLACSACDQENSMTRDTGPTFDTSVEVGDGSMDGDAGSDATGIIHDASDAGTRTSDAGADGDVLDADSGAMPEGIVECDCVDPEASCWNGRCARPDVSCPADECPEGFGYQCGAPGYCLCLGNSPQCFPNCQGHEDCPGLDRCGPSGYCVPPRGCSYDSACLEGEWCLEVDGHGKLCRPAGDVPPGEICDADEECISGVCGTGECGRRCLTDSDCSGDQTCKTWGRNTCHDSQCSVSCPDGVCSGTECRPRVCLRSGDCPDSDCRINPTATHTGQCLPTSTDSLCKHNEFRVSGQDPYCRLPLICNPGVPNNPCDSSYKCITNGADSPLENFWCSRRVLPGSWP